MQHLYHPVYHATITTLRRSLYYKERYSQRQAHFTYTLHSTLLYTNTGSYSVCVSAESYIYMHQRARKLWSFLTFDVVVFVLCFVYTGTDCRCILWIWLLCSEEMQIMVIHIPERLKQDWSVRIVATIPTVTPLNSRIISDGGCAHWGAFAKLCTLLIWESIQFYGTYVQ